MGRIIGLIGCTCLVIVTLRLTNLQHSDQTLKGGEDRVHAAGRLSPREHYKLGKEMYLRGKYRDAVQHLDAAMAANSGLTGTERRAADDFLDRARTRLQEAAEARTVRAQSDAWDEAPAKPTAAPAGANKVAEATRHRVEKLMGQAQAFLKKGDRKQAREMAVLAHQIAKDSQMTFNKNEVSPAEFLAKMQSPQGATLQAAATVPDWAADDASVGNAKPHRQMIQQTGAEVALDEIPVQRAASSSQQLSPRDQAVALIAQAREDFKAGRYDEARRRALAADELDVTFDVFDDRPELVLNDIDRATSTQTFANATRPKAASPAVAQQGKPQTGEAAKPAGDSKKQQATRLLEMARQDIANGNLDGAQAKAEQAADLNVAYKLFDEMPEMVLSDIAARRASEGIAAAPAASQNVASGASPVAKPKAMALIAKARQALQEERFDEARQLAIEAERLKAPYDLFDDRPDLVLADVARTAKRGPATPGMPLGDKAAAEGQNVNTAVARQNMSPAQLQAIEMLRQARQLMKAGRFEEARAKAEEAEQMNVTFPVFADRPDLVLADLSEKMGNTNVASRNARKAAIEAASGFETDPNTNPFAPSDDAGTGRNFEVTQADSVNEFAPTGSANELYNRGMRELNSGNRKAAYANFLAAHQTGQKLDYVKTQRIQDYLRELAPRSTRSGIQLTNNQVVDSDMSQGSTEEQPAPLDAAQQEQMVRVDRVRSDTLNAVFKAERLRGTDPEGALTLIDQTMAKVEGADLPPETSAALMKQLNKTHSGLQAEIVRQKPNLELKERNKAAMDAITQGVETKVRIEQETAKTVEEFNNLYKQQRYAEAEVLAKKLKEMDPKGSTAEMLYWKAKYGRRHASNETLKMAKDESDWKAMDDVEQGLVVSVNDKHPLDYGDGWDRIRQRKGKYRSDNRKRGPEELRIEESLNKRISLHEDQVPLGEVIKKIQAIADINIHLDTQGMEEEAATTNSLVSIEVDGIMVKSALNLILQKFNLAYMVDNEVLKITSRMRQQGELSVVVYSVADLVVPIPDPSNQMNDPFGNVNPTGFGGGQMSIPANGQGFPQVGQNAAGGFDPSSPGRRQRGQNMDPDFNALTELIVSTIAPDTWDQVGGPASVRSNETTLSLVIRQTQKIHEEITDLLDQLRRLQDLQVTIEVRFVTVSDRFFERIGIDFDFNMKPTTGYPQVDNTGLPLQTFGSVNLPQFGQSSTGVTGVAGQAGQQAGVAGAAQAGQAGQQAGQAGVAGQQQAGGTTAGLFGAGPTLNLFNNPSSPSIVGLKNNTTFSNDLSVPFQQGSFQVGVPTFGNYNPQAGMEMGLAILSDIEAFFFIQAAQGDQRNNLMFAPKVTVFNGQTGTVTDSKARPFVTSLIPTVGFASTGFQPVITTVNEGITLSVTAVVSSDRRYVRLSVNPLFSSITDVFTFSFVGGGGAGQAGGQAGQAGGQNQQGGQGGFGGGQFGGGGGGQGQGFGIGGGIGGGGVGGVGGAGGIGGGQAGQAGQRGQAAGGQSITVQQPVVEQVRVLTTVSVPDGGTILLGGIKRLKEGRNMSGVPILNKIPYVSRLFKNTGVGRETESLMLMITPRIIIQEEEEELLGLPRT